MSMKLQLSNFLFVLLLARILAAPGGFGSSSGAVAFSSASASAHASSSASANAYSAANSGAHDLFGNFGNPVANFNEGNRHNLKDQSNNPDDHDINKEIRSYGLSSTGSTSHLGSSGIKGSRDGNKIRKGCTKCSEDSPNWEKDEYSEENDEEPEETDEEDEVDDCEDDGQYKLDHHHGHHRAETNKGHGTKSASSIHKIENINQGSSNYADTASNIGGSQSVVTHQPGEPWNNNFNGVSKSTNAPQLSSTWNNPNWNKGPNIANSGSSATTSQHVPDVNGGYRGSDNSGITHQPGEPWNNNFNGASKSTNAPQLSSTWNNPNWNKGPNIASSGSSATTSQYDSDVNGGYRGSDNSGITHQPGESWNNNFNGVSKSTNAPQLSSTWNNPNWNKGPNIANSGSSATTSQHDLDVNGGYQGSDNSGITHKPGKTWNNNFNGVSKSTNAPQLSSTWNNPNWNKGPNIANSGSSATTSQHDSDVNGGYRGSDNSGITHQPGKTWNNDFDGISKSTNAPQLSSTWNNPNWNKGSNIANSGSSATTSQRNLGVKGGYIRPDNLGITQQPTWSNTNWNKGFVTSTGTHIDNSNKNHQDQSNSPKIKIGYLTDCANVDNDCDISYNYNEPNANNGASVSTEQGRLPANGCSNIPGSNGKSSGCNTSKVEGQHSIPKEYGSDHGKEDTRDCHSGSSSCSTGTSTIHKNTPIPSGIIPTITSGYPSHNIGDIVSQGSYPTSDKVFESNNNQKSGHDNTEGYSTGSKTYPGSGVHSADGGFNKAVGGGDQDKKIGENTFGVTKIPYDIGISTTHIGNIPFESAAGSKVNYGTVTPSVFNSMNIKYPYGDSSVTTDSFGNVKGTGNLLNYGRVPNTSNVSGVSSEKKPAYENENLSGNQGNGNAFGNNNSNFPSTNFGSFNKDKVGCEGNDHGSPCEGKVDVHVEKTSVPIASNNDGFSKERLHEEANKESSKSGNCGSGRTIQCSEEIPKKIIGEFDVPAFGSGSIGQTQIHSGFPKSDKGATTIPNKGTYQWNAGNPFLQTGNNIKPGSSTSNIGIQNFSGFTTTAKPIGFGNPFLQNSKENSGGIHNEHNVYDDNKKHNVQNYNDQDKGVTPHGELTYNKPIGQGNPFLTGQNGGNRGDVPINWNNKLPNNQGGTISSGTTIKPLNKENPFFAGLGGQATVKPSYFVGPSSEGVNTHFDNTNLQNGKGKLPDSEHPGSTSHGIEHANRDNIGSTYFDSKHPGSENYGSKPVLGISGSETLDNKDTQQSNQPFGSVPTGTGDLLQGVDNKNPTSNVFGNNYSAVGTNGGSFANSNANSFAGSFSSSHASSSSFADAKSASYNVHGDHGNNFDQLTNGNWPIHPIGNIGGSKSWSSSSASSSGASSGASAYASSSSNSWSGIQSMGVKS